MTVRLRERDVQALVLDIEGTTTPVAFVYDVLFPYARARLGEYLKEHLQEDVVQDVVRRLRAEWTEDVKRGDAPPAWSDGLESVAAYLEWLMERDRKSPGLKWLQGAIWDHGYRTGELRGVVFGDVPPAFERWVDGGIALAIYSSGSELAQRRLFGTTAHGDLTRFISRFFDTAVGPKTASGSYLRIAGALSQPAAQILFVSDTAAELDAARAAGLQVAWCVRPRTLDGPPAKDPPPRDVRASDPLVRDFQQIVL